MLKKITYISAGIFSSITLLAVLFKILHLQGAQVLLTIGLMGLALVFIPAFSLYKYYQWVYRSDIIISISGMVYRKVNNSFTYELCHYFF